MKKQIILCFALSLILFTGCGAKTALPLTVPEETEKEIVISPLPGPPVPEEKAPLLSDTPEVTVGEVPVISQPLPESPAFPPDTPPAEDTKTPALEEEKPSDEPAAPSGKPEETIESETESVSSPSTEDAFVTIYIECTAALPYQEKLGIPLPEDGVLLDTTTVPITPGSTSVYDVLRSTDMAVVGSSGYIRSIQYLSEKDCTAGSGWMYCVDGTPPIMGCGSYILQGGEEIFWYYVT